MKNNFHTKTEAFRASVFLRRSMIDLIILIWYIADIILIVLKSYVKGEIECP